MAGYYYNSSTYSCNTDPQCTSLTNFISAGYIYNGCIYCPFNYVLSSTICLQCSTSSMNNCARCNVSNTSQCMSCIYGYYFNITNQICAQCSVGCATCTNSLFCDSCVNGYTMVTGRVNTEQYICYKCNEPCATCQANPNYCMTCMAGFVFQGWKCVTTYNFGFILVLNGS
jgi:proprotein convertase subtilisin/kexin type 5